MSQHMSIISSSLEGCILELVKDYGLTLMKKLSLEGHLRGSMSSVLSSVSLEDVFNEMGDKVDLVKKPRMVLPFCGVIVASWCKSVRFNHGLHTQCTNKMSSESDYCSTCKKQVSNSSTGGPPHGDIRERMKFGLNYRDPKGKLTLPYANVVEKLKLNVEDAKSAAADFGWTIPDEHFVKRSTKRGRPGKSASVSDTESDTNGSKKKNAPEQVDLIAQLVLDAGKEMLGSDSDGGSSVMSAASSKAMASAEKALSKLAKREAKAAKREAAAEKRVRRLGKKCASSTAKLAKQKSSERAKAAKEALKAEKEAAKEALKAEKEALKAEKEAAKEALKAEKEAAKEALKAEKEAAKEALKAEKEAAKEALKAEKEAVKEALKAEKEAAKEALKAEKEAAKEALKAEKEALEAEKEAAKEALKAEKKAASDAKKAEKKAASDAKKAKKKAEALDAKKEKLFAQILAINSSATVAPDTVLTVSLEALKALLKAEKASAKEALKAEKAMPKGAAKKALKAEKALEEEVDETSELENEAASVESDDELDLPEKEIDGTKYLYDEDGISAGVEHLLYTMSGDPVGILDIDTGKVIPASFEEE
jgi:hypothetical protein